MHSASWVGTNWLQQPAVFRFWVTEPAHKSRLAKTTHRLWKLFVRRTLWTSKKYFHVNSKIKILNKNCNKEHPCKPNEQLRFSELMKSLMLANRWWLSQITGQWMRLRVFHSIHITVCLSTGTQINPNKRYIAVVSRYVDSLRGQHGQRCMAGQYSTELQSNLLLATWTNSLGFHTNSIIPVSIKWNS